MPLFNFLHTPANNDENVKENVLRGTLGALLFALAGGVLWVLLSRVGFLSGLSGIVGLLCAVKGYALFGKKESKYGIFISIGATVLVLVIAWYFSLSWDVYDVMTSLHNEGVTDININFFESFGVAHVFLEYPDVSKSYFINLIVGLVLSGAAGFFYLSNFRSRQRAAQEAAQNPPAVYTDEYEESDETEETDETEEDEETEEAENDETEPSSEDEDKEEDKEE